MVMRVNTEINTYTRVTQRQWLLEKLSLEAAKVEELQANFAGISHSTLNGLPPCIDPDRPPKNFKDAMSRDDKREWAEAYNNEYQDFKERNAFKVVSPDKGIRIHDTLTRPEYKEDNGTFLNRKVRLCARGNQLIASGGESFKSSAPSAPTLKATLPLQKQDCWQQSQCNPPASY